MVREVAERVLADEKGGLQAIAADLNRRGLRTTRGGQWTGGNLGRMLGQKRYGGVVELHGKEVGTMPGEPVLDRETYDAIQAKFAGRRRGQRPTAPYLLTGILACSDCKKTMNGGSTFRRADGSRPRVYKCPPATGGCGRSIMAEPVEEMVGRKMIALLADPSQAARIAKEERRLSGARKAKLDRLRAIDQELVALEVKRASEEIIDAAYDAAKAIWDRKRVAAQAELVALQPADGPVDEADDVRAEADAARLARATEDWCGPETTTDQRRSLIRRYRLRPVVLPKRPGTRRFDRERVQGLDI